MNRATTGSGTRSTDAHYDLENPEGLVVLVASESFNLDNLGNNIAFAPNLMNQYTLDAHGNTINYDARGNLIAIGGSQGDTYVYDALNRLTEVIPTNHSMPEVVYTYDSQNRRASKSVFYWNFAAGTAGAWSTDPESITDYVYDGSELVAEVDGFTGGLEKSYTWDPTKQGGVGGLLSVSTYAWSSYGYSYWTGTYLPVANSHGDIVSLIDQSSGAVVETYMYSAYGVRTASNVTYDVCPFGWDGYYHDGDTGLDETYEGEEWFPKLGTFGARDPSGEVNSESGEARFHGDPVNRQDITGEADVPWALPQDPVSRMNRYDEIPGIIQRNQVEIDSLRAKQGFWGYGLDQKEGDRLFLLLTVNKWLQNEYEELGKDYSVRVRIQAAPSASPTEELGQVRAELAERQEGTNIADLLLQNGKYNTASQMARISELEQREAQLKVQVEGPDSGLQFVKMLIDSVWVVGAAREGVVSSSATSEQLAEAESAKAAVAPAISVSPAPRATGPNIVGVSGSEMYGNIPLTGEFSIIDWSGYPAGLPRPQGPFRILSAGEYAEAFAEKKATNAAIRRQLPLWSSADLDWHEIQPIKYGGSPTDLSNKIPIPRNLHQQQVTPWWNALQRRIEGDD